MSKILIEFCKEEEIELHYIQSGKPAQNAYIERLNRTFREDVLDAYLFGSIAEVNSIAYQWQIDYNGKHSHKSLNGLSTWLFAKEILALKRRFLYSCIFWKKEKSSKTGMFILGLIKKKVIIQV